jgi:catechol 2,3-dioxygenase-like lactoylglutathione lyase family enzyme
MAWFGDPAAENHARHVLVLLESAIDGPPCPRWPAWTCPWRWFRAPGYVITAPAYDRPVRIDRLDHLVLTVADIDATVEFYTRVLGMQAVTFGAGRTALGFGRSKINLHRAGHEFEPKAHRPTPGSADLCLIADGSLDQVIEELAGRGVPIEEGPVERTGATGSIRSVYFRDPDRNLIEVSTYL